MRWSLRLLEDDGRAIRRVSGVADLRTGQRPRPEQTFRVASQTNSTTPCSAGACCPGGCWPRC